MNQIQIYTKGYCPFCKRAKATLQQLGLQYQEFDITNDAQLAQEMKERSQRRTVPQIFINGQHLGGNDDLQDSIKTGLFNKLLVNEQGTA